MTNNGLMKHSIRSIIAAIIVAASTAGLNAEQRSAAITAPPTDEIKRLRIDRNFYKKYINTCIPVISSEKVSDAALLEASHLVDKIIGGRKDILKAFHDRGVRIVIMAHNEFTTDIPVSKQMEPDFWNMRARGICGGNMVSCAEENLLNLKGDPYFTESIFIHEFGHMLHYGAGKVDAGFDQRLRDIYAASLKKGLWKGAYAAVDYGELWAEAVQTWFNANRENDDLHNHVDRREELKEYDPALAKLVAEVVGDTPWRYSKVTERKGEDMAHLGGYDPSKAPQFVWPRSVREGFRRWQLSEKARKIKKLGKKEAIRIHLIGGAREYKAVESLKAWSRRMAGRYLVSFTQSFGVDKAESIDNLEALKDADLLVVYARRLKIDGAQLKMVRDYIASGRPIVALRTASHAFQNYPAFDRQVLGGSYSGHLGGEKSIETIVNNQTARHPVMSGVYGWTRPGKLYRNRELARGAMVLLTGKGAKESYPVAWVRKIGGKQRVFYTSMGLPEDFSNDMFNRLLANAVEWAAGRPLCEPPVRE